MFKRIMKIFGIVFGGFVVIVGAFFGITALRGGFNEESIPVTELVFEGEDTNILNVYTLEDKTFKLNCYPLDATNQTIEVKTYDQVGVLDNAPKQIKAGEPFTLKIRKDANGNNVAGSVTLEFKAGSIATATINMQVDVAIPDNVLYFAGNTNDRYTATGKTFTLGKTTTSTKVYLKSELVNAFNVTVGSGVNKQNLKSAMIDYTYYNLEGDIIDRKTPEDFSVLTPNSSTNPLDNTTSWHFEIPIIPNESGKIIINAKMHRTYEIEQEYINGGFATLADQLYINPNNSIVIAKLASYNEFLNKYIKYFDTTEESYAFFSGSPDGKVKLSTYEAVRMSEKFIFVSCSAEINITAVNLHKIESIASITKFNVFDSVNYAKNSSTVVGNNTANNIINAFDLKLTLDNGEEEIENEDIAIEGLYDTLSLSPYLYVSADQTTTSDDSDSLINITKYNSVPVYGFIPVDGVVMTAYQPITANMIPYLSESEMPDGLQDFDPAFSTPVGYLIALDDDKSRHDFNYMSINERVNSKGDRYWEASFNVPLDQPVNEGDSTVGIKKALYIKFNVEGLNLNTNTAIHRETYSRVTIDYSEYEFSGAYQFLSLASQKLQNGSYQNLKNNMALNESLGNTSVSAGYSSREQNICVNTTNVSNFDNVQYKNVLYFAESESNKEGDNKKILTVGKYTFKGMDGTQYTMGENALEGERIPVSNLTNSAVSSSVPMIHALNASTTPVKLFAVVYLSDKEGNPIDLDGNKLSAKVKNEEESSEENYELYVIAISSLNLEENQIYINSFVDNLYYYTTVNSNYEFKIDEKIIAISIPEGSDWKRNDITSLSYKQIDENDNEIIVTLTDNDEKLAQYQEELKLKLLKGIDLNLSVTNKDKYITDDERNKKEAFIINTIEGNTQQYEFDINVANNEQIAFNNLCAEFTKDYAISVGTDVEMSYKIKSKQTENGTEFESIDFKLSINENVEDVQGSGQFQIIPNSDEANRKLPHSGIFNRPENIVTYAKNEVTITEVGEVEDEEGKNIERYQELVARYNGETFDSSLVFAIESEGVREKYTIPSAEKLKLDEAGIKTNVDLDSSIVDISANYEYDGSTAQGAINKYIELISGVKAVDFTLTTPNNIAVLTTDAVFTNEDNSQEGYTRNILYIGSKKVSFNGNEINIAGKDYEIKTSDSDSNIKYIVVPAGTYFPLVEENSKQYLLMLDELFEIEVKIDGEGDEQITSKYIITANNLSQERAATIKTYSTSEDFEVNEKTQDAIENYITNSNFIKGEEEGKEVFVIANIVVDNKYKFKRVITYNLKQKPIDLQIYNEEGEPNSSDVDTRFVVEENRGTIKLKNPETAKERNLRVFNLQLGQKGSPYVLEGNEDNNIFRHIVYRINGEDCKFVDGDTLVSTIDKVSGTELKIAVEDTNKVVNASITMTYKDYFADSVNQMVSKTIYITIEPNYTFEPKTDSGITITDNIYSIKLTENADGYNILDLFNNKHGEDGYVTPCEIKINEQPIENIKVNETYVLVKDEELVGLEKFNVTMEITLPCGDTKEITLEVTVDTDKTFDVSKIDEEGEDSGYCLLGANLYDYIIVKEDGVAVDEKKNAIKENGIKIEGYKVLTKDGNDSFSNDSNPYQISDDGVITGPINTNDVVLKIKVNYKSHNNNFVYVYVTIEGVKGYFNAEGKYDTTEAKEEELIYGEGINNSNIDIIETKKFITIYITTSPTQENPLILNNYFVFKGNNNTTLYPLIWNDSVGRLQYEQEIIDTDKEYMLYYATNVMGDWVYTQLTDIYVKVVVVDMFFDQSASMTSETSKSNLSGKEFSNVANEDKIISYTVSKTTGDKIDINSILKVFEGNNPINVFVKVNDDYKNELVATSANTSNTYEIYYSEGNGDKIFTGYKITVNINVK